MNFSRVFEPEAYVGWVKRKIGYKPPLPAPTYNADGMRLQNKNVSALRDPRFVSAYNRGMDSGHTIGRDAGSKDDIHIEFRAYIECWAATRALGIEGDFVCCGVNTGIFPLAICEYVDFNSTGRTFWLFDTYEGIPESQAAAEEVAGVRSMNQAFYTNVWDIAVQNFAPFPRAKLIKGMVPETLETAEIGKVAYLSIDMNLAYPERSAIEYFWPKLSSGAVVILDDYAFLGHEKQQATMDEFAQSVGVQVLTLPTGQGLLIKP